MVKLLDSCTASRIMSQVEISSNNSENLSLIDENLSPVDEKVLCLGQSFGEARMGEGKRQELVRGLKNRVKVVLSLLPYAGASQEVNAYFMNIKRSFNSMASNNPRFMSDARLLQLDKEVRERANSGC